MDTSGADEAAVEIATSDPPCARHGERGVLERRCRADDVQFAAEAPRVVVEQQERSGHCRSGVRDRDVELTVGARGDRDRSLDLLRHGHVALGDPHLAPGCVGTDLRRALFEDFAATGGERDDRTFTRERGRDAAPDAGTTPGDEGVRAAE